jgi:hypothetical protein
MIRNSLGFLLACTPGIAQITVIPAMVQPHSFVDMDAVGPAGPTTLAAIMAAGTNGGALLAGITLLPNTAAVGVYNANITLGRALGHDRANNQLILVDPPAGVFDAFDAEIDLILPSTEFGIAIGDWVSTMILEFRLQNALVGTITSPAYSTANAKFFRSAQPFDRVSVRASTAAGNWVIPELYIQNGYFWQSFGQGCPGSNGTPVMQALTPPQTNTAFQLQVQGLRLGGGLFGMGLGFSSSFSPVLGPLPFDLQGFGAPGCLVQIDVASTFFQPYAGSTGNFTWNLPASPAAVGITFFAQGFGFDAGVNPLGIVTSNAGAGTIFSWIAGSQAHAVFDWGLHDCRSDLPDPGAGTGHGLVLAAPPAARRHRPAGDAVAADPVAGRPRRVGARS